jgi:hypothetical protein
MKTDSTTITPDVLSRIRGEYTEMPGLRLTHQQAQRLWTLDSATCLCVLDRLIEAGFLRRTDAGQYTRVSDGPPAPPLRMTKASLTSAASPRRNAG